MPQQFQIKLEAPHELWLARLLLSLDRFQMTMCCPSSCLLAQRHFPSRRIEFIFFRSGDMKNRSGTSRACVSRESQSARMFFSRPSWKKLYL